MIDVEKHNKKWRRDQRVFIFVFLLLIPILFTLAHFL